MSSSAAFLIGRERQELIAGADPLDGVEHAEVNGQVKVEGGRGLRSGQQEER